MSALEWLHSTQVTKKVLGLWQRPTRIKYKAIGMREQGKLNTHVIESSGKKELDRMQLDIDKERNSTCQKYIR